MRRWRRPKGKLEKLAGANEIFAAHLELAADPMLMENVAEKIAEGMTAADAVHAASGELAALFAQIDDDEYLRARADDVRDVCRRILRQLVPSEADPFAAIPDGSILAADEPAPSDTARIGLRVRGVVTRGAAARRAIWPFWHATGTCLPWWGWATISTG